MTYQEFKQNLWPLLNLDNRSIIFHIIEFNDVYVGSGMIQTTDDLYESDLFIEECIDLYYEPEIYVENVSSYILGKGESDHADDGDIVLLQKALQTYESFFDQLICEEADVLCSLSDLALENPHYEEPEEEDDDEDEEEENW